MEEIGVKAVARTALKPPKKSKLVQHREKETIFFSLSIKIKLKLCEISDALNRFHNRNNFQTKLSN